MRCGTTDPAWETNPHVLAAVTPEQGSGLEDYFGARTESSRGIHEHRLQWSPTSKCSGLPTALTTTL